MKSYLRWVWRQFYLLLFWPTQFRREVEDYRASIGPKLRWGQRLRYVLKLLPGVFVLTVLAVLLTGSFCAFSGVAFNWRNAFVGGIGGVAFGIALAGALGSFWPIAFIVALTVACGISCGVAFGVAFGVAVSGRVGLALTATWGVTFGVAISVAVGSIFGVARRVAFDIACGVALSVAGGVAFGVAGGVAGGIAGSVAVWLSFWLTNFRLATYPLDLAIAYIAWQFGRFQPGAARAAWRLCPVAWNEVIWVPLPFVASLLALVAGEDRQEGLRLIAFVAAERPLQRRAASAALVEVSLDDLNADSMSELANVTERLAWTAQARVELPHELVDALPRLDRVSQHAAQSLTVRTAYRRREALEQALEEVNGLQRALVATRGRYVPRLQGVVNAWKRLLEVTQATLAAEAEISREIPNPFVFGNPIGEKNSHVFAGRRDIVEKIERSILGAAQTHMLLLHGPRRTGKSSILKQLPRLLGPDFVSADVDCQSPAFRESQAAALRYLSQALSQALRQKRVIVPSLPSDRLQQQPFSVFTDWLAGVEKAMPATLRALVCLDEFERLQSALDAGWGADFLDLLRHTAQHVSRVVLLFAGAHTFAELGPAWTDRFISARRVRVSFLSPDEVRPLLTKPIPEFDLTYAPGALEAIIAATRCQSFLVQAVAFELVQFLNEQQRREAAPPDVEEAITRTLESGGEYFANVWSEANVEGQAILRALAYGASPPAGSARRQWLYEHDVLDDLGGLAVPMMERWVIENAG